MPRPLGENQRHALRALAENNCGVWYPGAGWVWANTSTTIRLLDSLVRRGLATKTLEKSRRTEYTYPRYEITDAGKTENGT